MRLVEFVGGPHDGKTQLMYDTPPYYEFPYYITQIEKGTATPNHYVSVYERRQETITMYDFKGWRI